jgi:hypothetical protein
VGLGLSVQMGWRSTDISFTGVHRSPPIFFSFYFFFIFLFVFVVWQIRKWRKIVGLVGKLLLGFFLPRFNVAVLVSGFWIVEVSAIVVVGCYLLVFVHLWVT